MRILIAALALLAIPFLTQAQTQTMSEPSTPTTPPADATTATTTAYPGGRWQPPPARYTAGTTHETSITLEDGTRLAATVAYPVDTRSGARAAGPFPVIVEFTPYLRLGQPVGVIPYFVERGYIYAVVRPRGTGGSTGQMQQFTSQDGRDGAAVVDWAAALEGADGRVAMAGCSYPAATGLATAAAVRPGSPLKVVVSSCSGLDMQHRQVWTSNGLPNAALGAYAPRAGAMMGEQASVTGYFADFLKGVMAGGPEAYDGYWQDRLPLSRAADIVANGIPVLLWTGWSDINEIGGIHAYHALQNAAVGRPVDEPMDTARTDPRWQIIVGDWSHAQGPDVGVYLQWFETWLKGIDTGITPTKTPMHVYEMGTGRWLNLAGYPVVRTSTRLQLGPGGTLAEAMPAGDGSAQLRWGSPEARDGSVAFTSNPFADGATIAGPISATIYASSSNTNLELIANLYDVAPSGDAQRISIGALLGSQSRLDPKRSWRDDAGTMTWPWPLLLRDEYLQPDRMQRFDLFLALRQWGLAPGHRVRLVLTTQSPASVCPPEGEPTFVSEPCRLTAPQQATLPGGVYRIGFGEDQPSSLNLPLLAYRAFETVRSGPTPTGWDETNRRMAPATTTLPLDWGRMVAAPLRSEAQEMNQSPVEAGPPAGTSVLYPGGKWSPGPARFGVEVVEDVPVTMDDGVVLNASIAYPTDLASGRRARGPFPVVVEHMPYVQFAVPVRVNPFFAEHGYISVQVRARGLGKSGGEVQFLSPREGLDGKAIIEWAAHRLEGSDGRVGLIGCSWPGHRHDRCCRRGSRLAAEGGGCGVLGHGEHAPAIVVERRPANHEFLAVRRARTSVDRRLARRPALLQTLRRLGVEWRRHGL